MALPRRALPAVPDVEAQLLGYPVPTGRALELPGRGTTWIREVEGPPGAPVVFLLHGLGATAGLNWFPAFETLGRHFRVVAIDHRGHGQGIRSRGRFRLADCADDVVAVADALGINRFIAAGYSMGGPIAQLTWHRHQQRVEGLVLAATSRNFRGRPRERAQYAFVGMVAATVKNIPDGPVRRLLFDLLLSRSADDEGLAFARAELDRTDTGAIVQATDAIGRYSSHRWIGSVTVPTSVIVMTEDRLVPARRQLKLAQAIPGAVAHLVRGDHLVCAKAPAHFADVLGQACGSVADRARHGGPGLVSVTA